MIDNIYATPRVVENIEECDFYHTMDIPGHGTVTGDWDLRGGLEKYLGEVDFRGKRVLEVGTASGFVCFEMERLGADVVCCDLSARHSWDVVPHAMSDQSKWASKRRTHIGRLNNGYWFAHAAHSSKAKVVYSTVYDMPDDIGQVDISTLGCILVHVRDPFLALQRVLRLTRETVIVTEAPPVISRVMRPVRFLSSWRFFSKVFGLNAMQFLPDCRTNKTNDSWWGLTPEVITEFLGVLGFEAERPTYHLQKYRGRKTRLFTVVGHRVAGSFQGKPEPSMDCA